MDLNISIDFENQKITAIIDDSFSVSAQKTGDNNSEIIYSRFNKIESEDQQETLREVMRLLFTLEE